MTDFDEQLRYDRKYLSREGRRNWREQIEGGDDFDLKQVSPMQMGGRLNRPVLLAHGVRDLRVPFSQYLDMLEATEEAPVPPTTLVLEMAGHSFTRTRDEQFWYSALEGLLAKHNPADLIDTPAQGEAHAGGGSRGGSGVRNVRARYGRRYGRRSGRRYRFGPINGSEHRQGHPRRTGGRGAIDRSWRGRVQPV